jgi:curli biogenesis system outer membrane secretion channel CsgG
MSFRSTLIAAILLVSSVSDGDAQIGGIIKRAKAVAGPTKGDDKVPPPKAESNQTQMPSFTGPKKRLAVMDMEVKVGSQPGVVTAIVPQPVNPASLSTTAIDLPLPPDFGQGLTEMMTTSLFNTNRFILLERKAIADIQSELQLASTGLMNPDTGGKPGNLLGAQAIIRGAVTEFSYKRTQTNSSTTLGRAVDLHRTSTDAFLALDIRIFDAATGQILDSVHADGRAKSSQNEANVEIRRDNRVGGGSFSSSPLGAAAREAIDKAAKFICDRMESQPWEGAIAEMETENDEATVLYLNAGSRAGINAGDQFDIFRAGRPIVNPQTKVVIGRTRDTLIGRCKVETVNDDFSTAVPVQGQKFQMGDLIRMVGVAKP